MTPSSTPAVLSLEQAAELHCSFAANTQKESKMTTETVIYCWGRSQPLGEKVSPVVEPSGRDFCPERKSCEKYRRQHLATNGTTAHASPMRILSLPRVGLCACHYFEPLANH